MAFRASQIVYLEPRSLLYKFEHQYLVRKTFGMVFFKSIFEIISMICSNLFINGASCQIIFASGVPTAVTFALDSESLFLSVSRVQ